MNYDYRPNKKVYNYIHLTWHFNEKHQNMEIVLRIIN